MVQRLKGTSPLTARKAMTLLPRINPYTKLSISFQLNDQPKASPADE